MSSYSSTISGAGSFSLKSALASLAAHVYDHIVPHHRNQYHPHVLGHRSLALFSILLISVKMSALAVVGFAPALPAYSSAITPQNVVKLTNASRAEFDLGTLVYNETLAQAAQAKAEDMLDKQYFAHVTPDGLQPWDFMKSAGYFYIVAGENLAVNFSEAEDVDTAWMNSPGHRANILNKEFEEIGIGIARGNFQGHESTIVVQMFGARLAQPVLAKNQPTTVKSAVSPQPDAKNPLEIRRAQAAPVPVEEVLQFNTTEFGIEKDNFHILVSTSGNASKVLAQFGDRSVMLTPTSATEWKASIPLKDLAESKAQLSLRVYDIAGNVAAQQVASFNDTLFSVYHPAAAAATEQVQYQVLGKNLSLSTLEKEFYLFVTLIILAALLIAIAVKKHIQHINLIAHSSLVVILAIMLWTVS